MLVDREGSIKAQGAKVTVVVGIADGERGLDR